MKYGLALSQKACRRTDESRELTKPVAYECVVEKLIEWKRALLIGEFFIQQTCSMLKDPNMPNFTVELGAT